MLKHISLFIITLAICLNITAQDIESIFQEANQKLKNQDYLGAKKDYEKVIKLKSKHSKAHHNLGIIYYALQEYDKAKTYYSKAINLSPNEAKPYISRGALYYALKDFKNSEIDLNKAISLNENALGAYFYRGLLYKDLKKMENACKDWQRALKLGHPQAHKMIEKYCSSELSPDENTKTNKKAQDWYKSGEHKLDTRNYGAAIEDFRKAIELDPKYAKAYYSRGIAKYGKQDAEGACMDFKKALELGYEEAKAMLKDICGE